MTSWGEKKNNLKPALKLSRETCEDRNWDIRANYGITEIQNQMSLLEVFIYASDRKPRASLSDLAATEEILDITNYYLYLQKRFWISPTNT